MGGWAAPARTQPCPHATPLGHLPLQVFYRCHIVCFLGFMLFSYIHFFWSWSYFLPGKQGARAIHCVWWLAWWLRPSPGLLQLTPLLACLAPASWASRAAVMRRLRQCSTCHTHRMINWWSVVPLAPEQRFVPVHDALDFATAPTLRRPDPVCCRPGHAQRPAVQHHHGDGCRCGRAVRCGYAPAADVQGAAQQGGWV